MPLQGASQGEGERRVWMNIYFLSNKLFPLPQNRFLILGEVGWGSVLVTVTSFGFPFKRDFFMVTSRGNISKEYRL